MSVSGQGNDWRGYSSAPISEYSISPHGLKSAFPVDGRYVVDTRIADRMISTIQVISYVATVIVTGLILTMLGTSIYGILVTVR
jgi:hypothetical protein